MTKRMSLLVMLSVFLLSSAIVHGEQIKTTGVCEGSSEAAKAKDRALSQPDEYVSRKGWLKGNARRTAGSDTSTIPVIAANTVHYYDAQGNEVSEDEFKAIVEKERESHAGAKERARRVHSIPRSVEVGTEKHFLWSLETTENTIYFLGSMHVLTRDSYPLAKEIESAYDACQKIVFETDLEGLNDPGQQVKMVMLGLYPFGQTLQRNVSEETYTALKERVAGSGFSMAQFDRFRPWLCALTLAGMELQRLGLDPKLGVDSYFFSKAKKDGKERIFLELVEYQLGLFAEMDQQEQESFLRQTLEELKVMETMASDMVRSWKTGDVDKLGSILNRSFEDSLDMHERLVTKRNKEWISQIEKLMNQNDNVLVIVGAGHMVGTENLLELLKQKGHKITQSISGSENG